MISENELIELEKAATSYPVAASEAMLRIISEYRREQADRELQHKIAFNDGVLTTRETICRALMRKYGTQLGHDIWEVSIPYP